jgi:hypothetical protein
MLQNRNNRSGGGGGGGDIQKKTKKSMLNWFLDSVGKYMLHGNEIIIRMKKIKKIKKNKKNKKRKNKMTIKKKKNKTLQKCGCCRSLAGGSQINGRQDRRRSTLVGSTVERGERNAPPQADFHCCNLVVCFRLLLKLL